MFQHSVVNKKERKEINHYTSPFTMDMERSKYMQIDSNVTNTRKMQPIEEVCGKNGATAKQDSVGLDATAVTNRLSVDYCHMQTVNKNR